MWILLMIIFNRVTYPEMNVMQSTYNTAKECREMRKYYIEKTLIKYDVGYAIVCIKKEEL